MTKFIFMTGGVVSGIGKGISAASVGRLLKDRGFSVFMQKFDPYLNVYPGLLNPIQHGEVFVTKDGGETDLDLGHYERFIDEELTKDSSITSGKIYNAVFQKEKRGEFKGNTVQVIPHVTDEIKAKVYKVAEETNADVIITEIGGTVGDIESLPFIEAIRQIYSENNKEDVLFMHTTLVPTVPGSSELKTKPTQHSYKQLMSYGIKPNVFVLRSDQYITEDIKKKISLFCDIPKEAIVQSENVDLIYEVPVSLKKQGIDEYIIKVLNLDVKKDDFHEWEDMVDRFKNLEHSLDLAMVGKYVQLEDSYLSVNQALLDAGYNQSTKVNIHFIDSEELTKENLDEKLSFADGIVVPTGSGSSGIGGKLLACEYARIKDIPYLGVCLGMQILALEAGQNLLKLEDADSKEFNENCKNPILIKNPTADRRLGNGKIKIEKDTMAYEIYQAEEIIERHKHIYEFNNDYKEVFEKNNIKLSAINEEDGYVEVMEYTKNKFHMGTLYHPQYKSRPNRPHALFMKFIEKALEN